MLTFKKGLLIYNDQAGDDDVEAKLAAIVPALGKAVKELIILRPDSEDETREICENVSGFELVVIMGGDGTVHQCIDVVSRLDERPLIAILPGGTSNDFTRTLGISQNLKQAVDELVNGKVMAVDVGKEGNQHFINFWGIGLVAQTSENVDEGQKKSFGPLSYMASTIRTVREAESFSYQISANGQELTGEAVAIFVLNGSSLATTPIPINGISPTDGLLDLLVVKNSNLATLRELLALRKPKTVNEQLDMLEYVQANEFWINAPDQRQVDMDGEIYVRHSGHIEVLRGHLNMLVPRTMD
ncbi:diacylglycerol/lipid kinase family protein [Sporosarcina aquimarina]|uniref:YegS/Rv2252/BmrU family lipid kinase n=1 Tax=Sporosarcina aquimarina TaxID=114975 RepID=A0ABU4FVV0_9BACL|nr:YegS/Rv2252/BmrU family lipid kinase [Sporosarcina aquimarina]MDW0108841.1 YegS/Rv2252/BmrU family lipid kinase [Sporosarcina aquimarina]